MGRKRKGLPISGWINLDKPAGLTSSACVNAVRRATGAAKLGHAGTLDPSATGILPIALGEATKTMPYVTDSSKRYAFTVHWGARTTTDDADGEVVETSDARPDQAEIEAALPAFVGHIEQVPPAYSAIKIDGERAYAKARAGEDFEMTSRFIDVHAFDLLDIIDTNTARFTVTSGKGAYMRALARDLAIAVGTCGHLSDLRRMSVGPFSEEASISLEKLEQLGHSAAASPILLPVETALDGIPALALSEREANMLRNGQAVPVLRPQDKERIASAGDDGIVLVLEATTPVALVRIDGIQIRPVRVLNL
ncbi:MAG: tRNA pseudouridine(55) synthase TruB [Alphaproteobacteria bacterium]|jgi:tRNA pseudouridine55 synthase|nr:tRNA pseudouridine(55) synthase TruB [Alphaproteobacteria bacterium]